MKRRAILLVLLNCIAFLWRMASRAEARPDAASYYAKVEEADSAKGTAKLMLTVKPSAIWFSLHGDVKGLNAGDWIDFHLGRGEISWKDRKIKLVEIILRP